MKKNKGLTSTGAFFLSFSLLSRYFFDWPDWLYGFSLGLALVFLVLGLVRGKIGK